VAGFGYMVLTDGPDVYEGSLIVSSHQWLLSQRRELSPRGDRDISLPCYCMCPKGHCQPPLYSQPRGSAG
jgi:hypothetical protein